jgi:hypothetical protein
VENSPNSNRKQLKRFSKLLQIGDPTALLQQALDDFKAAAIDLPSSWDDANTGRATKWSARLTKEK